MKYITKPHNNGSEQLDAITHEGHVLWYQPGIPFFTRLTGFQRSVFYNRQAKKQMNDVVSVKALQDQNIFKFTY
jgi:hypothetical protein